MCNTCSPRMRNWWMLSKNYCFSNLKECEYIVLQCFLTAITAKNHLLSNTLYQKIVLRSGIEQCFKVVVFFNYYPALTVRTRVEYKYNCKDIPEQTQRKTVAFASGSGQAEGPPVRDPPPTSRRRGMRLSDLHYPLCFLLWIVIRVKQEHRQSPG